MWRHELAWLPDSFGFAAGLPAVAAAEGVRWFCTHKLAWNAGVPFPHRLFRWRSRGGAELKALMLPPIGTSADPAAIEAEQRAFRLATGMATLFGSLGWGITAVGRPQRCWSRWASGRTTPVHRDALHGEDLFGTTGAVRRTFRSGRMSFISICIAPVRPAVRIRSVTTAAWSGWCVRRISRLPCCSCVIPTGSLRPRSGPPCCFISFTTSFPGPPSLVFDQAEPLWHRSRRSASALRNRQLTQLLGDSKWIAGPGLDCSRWRAGPRCCVCREVGVSGQGLAGQGANQGGTWVQLPEQHGVVSLRWSAAHRLNRARLSQHPLFEEQ